MLQVFRSPSAAERLEAALALVESLDPGRELLVVGATREAADDFCRNVARRRTAVAGLHRLTLAQLASRTAGPALAAQGLAICTPLAAEAIAARALFEIRRTVGLQHFEPVADCPGVPRALARTIGELRQAGVEPAALRRLPMPGSDLANLLEEFARQLDTAQLIDRARLFAETLHALRRTGLPAGAASTGLPALLLDVRIRTQAEREIVHALAASANVLMTVPEGDLRTLRLVAGAARTKEGSATREARGSGSSAERSALARLRTQLFSDVAVSGDRDESVVFFSAPGEGRECVEIARRVLMEAGRGVPFDQIAIVVRTPDTYWGLMEHALHRAGVPAWFARGTLRPDPSGRAFLALLACKAEGLSARRFGEYLSLGQVPKRDDRGAPAPDPPPFVVPREESLAPGQLSLFDLIETTPSTTPAEATGGSGVRTPWKWESLIVESSVIGGADRWQRRLDGLARELTMRLADLEAEEPDSPQSAAVRRDLASLADLRSFALPILEELDAWPARLTWGHWLTRLEALAPRVLRHPVRVLELLTELRPMAAVGPLSLAEVRQVLLPRLSTLEHDPPRQRFGRVFVGTPDQVRGRAFRVVFVCGLAERIFPQKARQDPMLLDNLRRALDADLPLEDDAVIAERLLLRLAVGAAVERLYVSYPRLDVAQARARVPSFYALDVVRAVQGSVPHYDVFERETAQATGAWLAWPAPARPEDAIDESEHDLAVLGPLLEPGARDSAARGRARYLLTLNAHLAQSLRTRWARWRQTWSPYDGLVAVNEQTKARLASQRLGNRPYSVSALQRFAACPYQFLLGAIYRFEPFQEPEAIIRLDPLTKGALFHEVQRDVLRALQAADLLPLVPDNVGRSLELLDRTLADVAQRYHDQLAPAIERIWRDEIDGLGADLRTWLRRMAEATEGWIPKHFEFSFGLPVDAEHDPASVADPVRVDGRFLLRGAIDLVEEHMLTGRLRVTDHKTGKNRTGRELVVGGGATLQPVIYGLVAEQVFGRTVSQSRLSFPTSAGGYTDHEVSLREEARRAGLEVLEIIDRAVERGDLPPAPRASACGWCDFRAVCGPHEERRLAVKDREWGAIADLNALRKMP